MKVVVLLRMVPDVVEGLEIAPDRRALDPGSVRLILSESDNHALEQALLLKESRGAHVTVLALETPEIEDALFTALAKGADKAIKIVCAEQAPTTRRMTSVFSEVIEADPELGSAELILTGVRTITDLDAPLAPLLARRLRRPHLGIVSRMTLDYSGRSVTAVKEFPHGIRGEFEVRLPAVLSIQAAERPPRYVPVVRVREAMRNQSIERVFCAAAGPASGPSVEVLEMRKPHVSVRAAMLTGPHEVVARRLREVLVEAGLVQGA